MLNSCTTRIDLSSQSIFPVVKLFFDELDGFPGAGGILHDGLLRAALGAAKEHNGHSSETGAWPMGPRRRQLFVACGEHLQGRVQPIGGDGRRRSRGIID